jgi:Flp pilus assembly protein TadD
MRLGRHDEAITAFRKVTELRPNNGNVRHLLAQELAAVGRSGSSIASNAAAGEGGPAIHHRRRPRETEETLPNN